MRNKKEKNEEGTYNAKNGKEDNAGEEGDLKEIRSWSGNERIDNGDSHDCSKELERGDAFFVRSEKIGKFSNEENWSIHNDAEQRQWKKDNQNKQVLKDLWERFAPCELLQCLQLFVSQVQTVQLFLVLHDIFSQRLDGWVVFQLEIKVGQSICFPSLATKKSLRSG